MNSQMKRQCAASKGIELRSFSSWVQGAPPSWHAPCSYVLVHQLRNAPNSVLVGFLWRSHYVDVSD